MAKSNAGTGFSGANHLTKGSLRPKAKTGTTGQAKPITPTRLELFTKFVEGLPASAYRITAALVGLLLFVLWVLTQVVPAFAHLITAR